jgi:hypothetical protein
VPDGVDAQVDEVGGAGEAHGAQQGGRPLDERPDPGSDGHDLRVGARGVADDGGERGAPPERHAAADHEQHAGARHHDEQGGGPGEREEHRQVTHRRHSRPPAPAGPEDFRRRR